MVKLLAGPISKPEVIACIPIHILDAAIPKEAKFPDFSLTAKPCKRTVARKIIAATPNSSRTEPAVDPIANRTKVACAAIASWLYL